jgi:hypothetical protein
LTPPEDASIEEVSSDIDGAEKSVAELDGVSKQSTGLSDGHDEDDREERRKLRKGSATILGVVASVFGLIAIFFSIFVSFEGSSVQQSSSDIRIHIDVTINASQFHDSMTNTVCAGSGPIDGIVGSVLTLTQASSGLRLKSVLGSGTLTQDGSCLYVLALTPPSSFSGGKIEAAINFPFGASPATTFDIGTVRPFPYFPLAINLG